MDKFLAFPSSEIAILIDKLNPETPGLWGTMTAQHMLEHLLLPLEFSRGLFSVPLVTPADKVEKVKRIMLMSEAPLKRDFAAPFLGPGLQPLKFETFTKAQEALKKEVEVYIEFWEANPDANFTHPIFGPLNKEEWYLFQRKHFTHHFSQFGLVEF
jgi:hypothetical protein